MKVDEEEFVLRPMNCPHHMLIYKSELHSYRDLPIKIGELAHDFRYEDSGAVCGLERVRQMCQNDAHLFVRPDQIKDEFKRVVDLIFDVYKDFNITEYRCVLSLRDPLDKEKKLGYLHVLTPCVGTVNLYKTSGHWDHYKDNMFPAMEVDGEAFVLRPMNCPHHMMIYANKLHSYKDLPIRIGEIAHDFRFEASGAVKGIERGRHFCQNDAHLFVTPEQIKDEFKSVVDLIFDVYKDFNITDYRCVLSLRDPEDKEKYHPDDEMWNKAENELREVLNELGIEYTEEIGEAAFYGPKLDVNVKPAVGNEYTLSTCQLDFCLPAKFDLKYVDKDGEKKTPVVLHRAILGSLDRFMAYILEETKGALPLWLSPRQVNIIPVNNEYHLDYSNKIKDLLLENDIRVELDDRDEKLNYKMRESVISKVPYTLILGDKEKSDNSVSYRTYGSNETKTLNTSDFIDLLKNEIKNKGRK